ncbi:hypothetical protein F5X96DRAFT_513823 [Biscogniauxia mediterranea]|nr:hypothetical protein F5X96DRAFT_513823 [Biscogniauxia mediterranea]
MLPPINEDVLGKNPEFAKVYKTITGSLLNPDGSTKGDAAAEKRDQVREELKAHRLKATRLHLLREAIATADPRRTPASAPESSQPPERTSRRTKSRAQSSAVATTTTTINSQTTPVLPPELCDLLLMIPVFLSKASSMPPDRLALLLGNPPFTHLPTYFPQLAALVSARLARQASTLARLLHPNTNPSYIHRSIPSLHATAAALLAHLAERKAALSQARLQTAHALTRHLARHAAALALVLRGLEAKHGPAARATELRAEEARVDARAWALACEALLWDTRREVYPPEARAALENYRRHLRDARRRLADGVNTRKAELRDYGVVVGDGDDDDNDDNNNHDHDADDGIGKEGDGDGSGGGAGAGGNKSKERTMREMARVWREMDTRLKEVRADLARLG